MTLATGFIGIPELMAHQLWRFQQHLPVRPMTAPSGLLSHQMLKHNWTQRLSSFYRATVSQATCRGHVRDAQAADWIGRERGTLLSASAAAWELSAESVGHTVLVSSLKRSIQSSMWQVGWPC